MKDQFLRVLVSTLIFPSAGFGADLPISRVFQDSHITSRDWHEVVSNALPQRSVDSAESNMVQKTQLQLGFLIEDSTRWRIVNFDIDVLKAPLNDGVVPRSTFDVARVDDMPRASRDDMPWNTPEVIQLTLFPDVEVTIDVESVQSSNEFVGKLDSTGKVVNESSTPSSEQPFTWMIRGTVRGESGFEEVTSKVMLMLHDDGRILLNRILYNGLAYQVVPLVNVSRGATRGVVPHVVVELDPNLLATTPSRMKEAKDFNVDMSSVYESIKADIQSSTRLSDSQKQRMLLDLENGRRQMEKKR